MRILGFCLTLFLQIIRPLLGPAICYFTPSCSEYAYHQLAEKSFLTAIAAIIRRLISCNSFTI